VQAMIKEIEMQKAYLESEPLSTIYFGGGTPSLLNIEELKLLLDTIYKYNIVLDDAEITLEANPDNISEEQLLAWKNAGVNRLSIGVQSFFEEDLKWMNRAHNSKQAIECIELATKHFNNITIDLIYGTPGLTDEKWKMNVDRAISLGIEHLSCYALTVESHTPLDKLIREEKRESVDSDQQASQFLLLMKWMKEAGFRHYEISNFAKPGKESKHNSSYWQGERYLGIGPAAHSFNGISRQWNIANNQRYISSINEGKIPSEIEILSPIQVLNEYIMTALRTDDGINLNLLKNKWEIATEKGENPLELLSIQSFELIADSYVKSGHLTKTNTSLVLTELGKLLADGIASDLFF
jgi:oxygen-independent coproporphyrinogen-3 oxidase